MNKHNDSTDQRISAFINRKAKQFPDIDRQRSAPEEVKQKGFFETIFQSLAIGR